MSFSTISISREFPIINGSVIFPSELESFFGVASIPVETAQAEVEYDNSIDFFNTLSAGTGPARLAGERYGLQEFFKVPVELTMNIALLP